MRDGVSATVTARIFELAKGADYIGSEAPASSSDTLARAGVFALIYQRFSTIPGRRSPVTLPTWAAFCWLSLCAAVPPLWAQAASGAAASGERARAESELGQIRREIDRVREQLSRDAAERDRLARELRGTERSVLQARGGVDALRRERAEKIERRRQLVEEQRTRERQLVEERQALASQLRAAYTIGREEPLKLLLNQRDPARAGRLFAYYGYFGRARAGRISAIGEQVAQLAELDRQLAVEEAALAELEERQREELSRLERARVERRGVLASLREESRSREQNLRRLRSQQAALEKLLRELRRTIERLPPVDDSRGFARTRGRLGWPVAGRLLARFGQTRAGGLKWDGVLIAAARGAPVRAVARGRVVYADWLAGLGLLVIVDHGEGYLSLYGHNEQIFKKVGETVAANESLSSGPGSSGRPRELHHGERTRSADSIKENLSRLRAFCRPSLHRSCECPASPRLKAWPGRPSSPTPSW
jgi:murein hydrolase activator